MQNKARKIGIAGGVVALVLSLSACDLMAKVNEPFNDAKRSGEDSSPAKVITMPDGFSNLATKCVDGVRYTVAFHGDNPYGSVSVTNGCK